ncbi:MAG: transglutaminase-like domain-containing protein [Sporichthyaceae bacterium]
MSKVGATLTFAVSTPVSFALQVAVARRDEMALDERWLILNNDTALVATELLGVAGARQHLLHAEPGELSIAYEAILTREGDPGTEAVSDAQRIEALRPSRYCPSDRLVGFARLRFDQGDPIDRVRAICDYVWRHVSYVFGTSGPTTSASDTLLSGEGVCRDFAHVVAALCRAVEVPARIAAVYAPGLWSMDLHAVVETEIDGVWQVWDATRLAPRDSLVRIATGRDAADIAFATVLTGQAQLTGLEILAVAPDDLTFDDHQSLAVLR